MKLGNLSRVGAVKFDQLLKLGNGLREALALSKGKSFLLEDKGEPSEVSGHALDEFESGREADVVAG